MLLSHLEAKELMPYEQKGCTSNSKATKDQLLIDKMIFTDCKQRHKNLSMAWLDFRKAFDSVPHDWILYCLRIFGVHKQLCTFIKCSMELWTTTLYVNGTSYGDIKIQRGIFQGDSLSPLLFIMALIPLSLLLRSTGKGYRLTRDNTVSHLLYMDDIKLYGRDDDELTSLVSVVSAFSTDICMSFGLSKCNCISLYRGKLVETSDVPLPSGEFIQQLAPDSVYQYLGVFQADNFKTQMMKEKLVAEYKQRLRKILKSYLSGRNVIQAINSYAAPVMRYSGGIIHWTKEDLHSVDVLTRKQLTLHRAFHQKGDVDRLYVPRTLGGRGLLSIEEIIVGEERNLSAYLSSSPEPLLRLAGERLTLSFGLFGADYKESVGRHHLEVYVAKPLHGQFMREITNQCDHRLQWSWLCRSNLDKETEGFVMAAQEQALATNVVKSRIHQLPVSPLCRLCHSCDETVDHLTSSCSYIAQSQYKARHDQVALFVHWHLCKSVGFDVVDKWWNHLPMRVLSTSHCKILWDFTITTDRVLHHNRPDIVLSLLQQRRTYLIDITIPGDSRMTQKTTEKLSKYRDLQIEVDKMWHTTTKVVPIVLGALGSIPSDLCHYLSTINLPKGMIATMQKSVLLSTARILRRYLNI